jgi:hypothetical protein
MASAQILPRTELIPGEAVLICHLPERRRDQSVFCWKTNDKFTGDLERDVEYLIRIDGTGDTGASDDHWRVSSNRGQDTRQRRSVVVQSRNVDVVYILRLPFRSTPTS